MVSVPSFEPTGSAPDSVDSSGVSTRGRKTLNVVPRPSSVSTSICPPLCFTMPCTVEIEYVALQHLPATQGEQLARQRGAAPCRPQDLLGVGGRRVVRREASLQDLRIAHHDGEQVVEIVRHAPGQLSNRLHSLRLAE